MSANGLDTFDKTLQTTNIWLDEIMEDLGPDRKTAWRVLAVVLHRLRNRLPLGLAANLGAQLPILVRGIYYDQFQPEQLPDDCDTLKQFCAEIGEWLQDNRPINLEQAVRSVFALLSRHISTGEIGNVVQALPEEIRQAWPKDALENAREQMKQSAEAQQQSADRKGGGRESKAGVTQWGAPEYQPGGGVENADESLIARKDGMDLEPASAEAEQTMVGGTSGNGPAR